MGCLSDFTLKGIGLDCNPVLAGIKRVYLGYNDQFTITPDKATQTATIAAKDGLGGLMTDSGLSVLTHPACL